MTYSEAQAYVLSLQSKGWRMGLDRIQELVQRAGLEDAIGKVDLRPSFFHVAGTNGKGSVTQYIQSILIEAGYNVGGYYSPYVYNPRERIQFDRELISEEDYASAVSALEGFADKMATPEFDGGPSKFEFETAMGFLYWKRKQCEFIALEVGMGGRLDATNVVTPAVSVIVSIGLDHTQYLGKTHAGIAREKAGIIKPGVPVIAGAMPEAALVEIEKIAQERGAPLWCFGQEIRPMPGLDGAWSVETPRGKREGLIPGMKGVSQPHNMALAVAAIEAANIEVDADAMPHGVAAARLPGRFEVRSVNGVEVILDGAHNTEAAKVLVRTFQREFPKRKAVLLTGMLEGHEPESFYRGLQPIVEISHVSSIDFHRALSPARVAEAIVAAGIATKTHGSAAEALDDAFKDAKMSGLPLLVTGSFYLLGEIGATLQDATR